MWVEVLGKPSVVSEMLNEGQRQGVLANCRRKWIPGRLIKEGFMEELNLFDSLRKANLFKAEKEIRVLH